MTRRGLFNGALALVMGPRLEALVRIDTVTFFNPSDAFTVADVYGAVEYLKRSNIPDLDGYYYIEVPGYRFKVPA